MTNSFCSYWIRPPPKMSALDHIDISFSNFKKNKVKIFIVTEGPNEEI
jgi:hypothetical protein